jgi:cell division protein ZipA
MIQGLSDTTLLRIGIGIFFVVVLLVVVLASRRKRLAQGERVAMADAAPGDERIEPTLREIIESEHHAAEGGASPRAAAGSVAEAGSELGSRPASDFDKIVSVFMVARAGQSLSGPDLVVAAEKAGLVYGNMNIFHRMVDNHPELGPIFSVANLVKPGYFDLRSIKELQTPGVNFFITLPGPISALDAWDTLLPTAQRMAELLDAVLLDEERNALGRQRIANIRDELRVYDRSREKLNIRPGH